MPETVDKSERPKRVRFLVLALIATVVACWAATSASGATAESGASTTRIVYAPGQIVPLSASIPHEEGDMVDRRIVPDLRWIAQRYPIFVVDGYSGRLPNGEHVGCHGCHVKHSDHYNGLAVDVVPLNGSGRCDATWNGVTRLARWAEPVQNSPRAPFRWVGYDGDAGHGCGNHLHLSWEHSTAPMFQLAEWVEVFPVRLQGVAQQPEAQPAPQPRGGVSVVQSGGIGAGD